MSGFADCIQKLASLFGYLQNRSPSSRPQICPGWVRSYLYFGLCPLSRCSTLKIILLDYCPPFKLFLSCFRGLTLEVAFLEDVDIVVTAYCLPEDEPFGKFG